MLSDFFYAFRTLRKSPIFTITVIVSKGLQTATPTVTASPTPKPTTST